MSIRIFYDNVNFRLRRTREIKIFLEKVIREQNKIPGDLSFIFKSDKNLLEINRKFLNHNYYTDVISFDYSDCNILNSEVYISIDTVRKNAKRYKVTLIEEIVRVMLHGTLHLCGHDDKEESSRRLMFRIQEEKLRDFLN